MTIEKIEKAQDQARMAFALFEEYDQPYRKESVLRQSARNFLCE